MKRFILILLTIAVLLNVAYAKQMHASTDRQLFTSPAGYRMPPRRNIPQYTFSKTPVTIMTSYFDYMIGSFNGLPVRVVPPTVTGAYFMTFQGNFLQNHFFRNVFYAYLFEYNNSPLSHIITDSHILGGYPTMAVDPVSGKPMFAWHGDADDDPELEVMFVSDSIEHGFSGHWNDTQVIIDNPITITAPDGSVTNDNEFIWPTMQIGPSPIAGKSRVYVLARNTQGGSDFGVSDNAYIAYADFNGNDLENGVPLVWSHTSIPELNQWNLDQSVFRRPFHAFTVDNSGNLYYAGYHRALGADGISSIDEELLDIFVCPNYGEGQWTRLSFWDQLPTWNPPASPNNPAGYFVDSYGQPLSDDQLSFRIANCSNHNASVDQHGRVHVPCIYALSSNEGHYYPDFQYVKEFVYDPATQSVTINDIYPQRTAGDDFNSHFTPWDVEAPFGVVDGFVDSGGITAPRMVTDFPFPHWDLSAHNEAMMFHYNNLKISNANEYGMMVAVWQSSHRARMYNEYNDSDYAAFADTPEIWISVSPNNGDYWSEPIVLNNVETPEFGDVYNVKPMWAYPADSVIFSGMLGDLKMGKVGLMFYDDFTWGANSLTPPYHAYQDGGKVMFAELEIVFPEPGIYPEDPFGEPVALSDSMTLMAEVTIDGIPATENDILAAYVTVNGQEQLRGKENIVMVNGVAGCPIQIFTQTNGEDISFQVWDNDRHRVLPASAGITSQPNEVVGSWPDDLFLINASIGAQTVENPTFDTPGGNYLSAQYIELGCPTPGAMIRYTIDGRDPTEYSSLYTEPIYLPENSMIRIKAKAFKGNWTPSQIVDALYIITGTVATPIFAPPAGYYTSPQHVTISCPTYYTQIRFTMNGTEPTQSSYLYIAPIILSTNSNYTIKAKAYRSEWIPSSTVSARYYITGTVPTPVFDPPEGMYMREVQVSIICHTSNADVHYTLDGSTPDESSPIFTEPITITEDTTISAIAFKTDWLTSEVAEGSFEIIPVSNPDDTQAPLYTGIHNVYPNPFADATTIRIGIKEPSQEYQLNIYNLKGQRVHQYAGNAKGFQDYRWDGCDASGKKLPAGIYILRMQTPTHTSTKKIVRQ